MEDRGTGNEKRMGGQGDGEKWSDERLPVAELSLPRIVGVEARDAILIDSGRLVLFKEHLNIYPLKL
jgi:hypothetical protein